MIKGNFKIRIRYADTDQMGYVYYGRYANFYEIARVELFRSLGFSYKDLEDKGVGMPVIEMNSKFLLPIKYDEEIKIVTYIKKIPNSKITFTYTLFNSEGLIVNEAKTILTFIDLKRKRPVRIPTELMTIIKKKFNDR
tara:strand:- start:27 stop:440 length:414 start_codon:yes stop_codon:yes gene_type:complete